jgi:tRNA(fMet)-specific endonuclease VapC
VPLYVLDTNNLRLLSRGVEPLSSRVRAHPPDELAVAVISVRESLDGWYNLLAKAKSPSQIELAYQSMIDTIRLLARYHVLNFSQPAQIRFEGLLRQKLNVGGNDLRIAAIAQEHAATVVTANVRDFTRVPGLLVEDWSV